MLRHRYQRVLTFLIRSIAWKIALGVAMIGFVAFVLHCEGDYIVSTLLEQEDRLLELRRQSSFGLFFGGFTLYFVACFVPGTNGKAFLAGWLFGAAAGTMLINCASMLAAIVMFLLARHTMREVIASRYAGHLLNINRELHKRGGEYLFALRLVPVAPFSILNLLMGVTELKPRTFWWATQLGILPSNIAFAWAGASLPTLDAVHQNGWSELLTWQLAIALVALALLPLTVRRIARRTKSQRLDA